MELIVLLIAPVLQLVASIMRLNGVLKIRLIYIALAALALGIAMTFVSARIVADDLAKNNFHCGMPMIGAFFMGLCVTLISTPFIGGVFYIAFKMDKKKATQN